jgi:hypothetical protein
LGDIEIQLEPGGPWHKRNPDNPTETCCGETLVGRAYKSRDHGRGSHLCEACWGRAKLDTARMQRLESELAEEHPEIYYEPDEDPTDPEIVTPPDLATIPPRKDDS